jgi:putative hydrolase
MLEKIEVDTHTHTVLSGHAWSTLRENAAAGRSAGLLGICLTEHGHGMNSAIPDFLTLTAVRLLPPELEGLRMFYGVEANIMGLDGRLDIADHMLAVSRWTIASMHGECMESGTEEENTRAFVAALRHPAVDMLGHIDDMRTPNRFETVIREAAAQKKIIEINNNSLKNRKGSIPRVEEIARLCAKHGVRVAVSSDAHFDEMVGRVRPGLELLARVGFPDELVVNRTMAAFDAYLEERRVRMEKSKA